jgi:hypothetical protein
VRAISTLLCVLLKISIVPALAQTSTKSIHDNAVYVLQVQRGQPGQHTCMLVQNDSQYHYERDMSDEIEIFEGTLDTAGTQVLRKLVNDDAVRLLSKREVKVPLILDGFDDLSFSILRPDGWQTLHFPDATSRTQYRQELDPLLELMTSLRKQPHPLLDEERSRNNCQPPGEIVLKKRPGAQAPPAAAEITHEASTAGAQPFLFKLFTRSIEERHAQTNCVVVHADGTYHQEMKAQTFGKSTVTLEIFEDHVGPEALKELPGILDDPQLWSAPHEQPSHAVAVRSGTFSTLLVPHDGKVRNAVLWKYYSLYRLGMGAQPDIEDNGIKLLKPLEHWVKINLDVRKLTSLRNAGSIECASAE